MKASVTEKICFCSGLGAREPRSLPSGEETRAGSGSRENKARFGSLESRVTSRPPQNSRGEPIPAVGTERSPFVSLGKGTKQQEIYSAGQESSFWNLGWPLSRCVTLDESPYHSGLQIAHLSNSKTGPAFLARILSLLELCGSCLRKRTYLPFNPKSQRQGSFFSGCFVPVVVFPFSVGGQEIMISSKL